MNGTLATPQEHDRLLRVIVAGRKGGREDGRDRNRVDSSPALGGALLLLSCPRLLWRTRKRRRLSTCLGDPVTWHTNHLIAEHAG